MLSTPLQKESLQLGCRTGLHWWFHIQTNDKVLSIHHICKETSFPVIVSQMQCDQTRCTLCETMYKTRKHSSRMHTTHLEAINQFQWPPPDVTPVASPNEQVWTGFKWSPPDVSSRRLPRSDVQRHGSLGLMSGGRRLLYHVTYPTMHLMLTTPCHPPPLQPPCIQTCCVNVTFLQLCWRAVKW